MAFWSDFYPLVMPWAPGAPEPAIDAALRQASIEFYEKTLRWQKTLAGAATVANAAELVLADITNDQAMAKLLSAKLAGRPLTLIRADDLDAEQPAPASTPDYASVRGPRSIDLYPAPATAGVLVVARVALKPSQMATQLPDAQFEEDAAAIAAGALEWLCKQPGQSYSNAGVAADKGAIFVAAIGSAKAKVFSGGARSRPRTTASYF